MDSMTTSETLNLAADLIQERGWAHGEGWHHERGGPLCLEGAVIAASRLTVTGGAYYSCPAYKAVRSYLNGVAPFRWNDDLFHDRVIAAIESGETLAGRSMSEIRAKAAVDAATEVIEVLRATALIEAAKENADVAESVTA